MTLSLAAVFIPVLFMGGIVGRLFHEFAVTIGVAILVSGFVSLTLTPMLCSRFLRPAGAGAPRPHLRGLRARLRRHAASSTSGRLTWVAAPPARHDAGRLARSCWSRPCCCSWSSQGLHRRARTRAAHRARPRRREGISFKAMVEHQKAVARDHREGPERRVVHVHRRPHRRLGADNTGLVFIRLKPRSRARAHRRTRSSRNSARSSTRIPGIVCLPAEPAADPDRRAARRRASTSSRCRVRTTRSSFTASRRMLEARSARCRASRTSRATCGSRTRRSTSRSTATRPRRWAFRRRRSRHALYDAYGTRQISTIYAPEQHVPGHHGTAAGVPVAAGVALDALRAVHQRQAGAAERGGAARIGLRAADRQPFRPVALGHDLVQPHARRAARRRRRSRRPPRRRPRLPATITPSFQGRRRRSSPRSPASGCCWSWRSWSSTWSWASCTRASSTR